MKRVEAYIRPEKLADVREALAAGAIVGVTVAGVRGSGSEEGRPGSYRGQAFVIDLHDKVKIEVICSDSRSEWVVNVIVRAARTGAPGDGKVTVTALERVVSIRTGAGGEEAVV